MYPLYSLVDVFAYWFVYWKAYGRGPPCIVNGKNLVFNGQLSHSKRTKQNGRPKIISGWSDASGYEAPWVSGSQMMIFVRCFLVGVPIQTPLGGAAQLYTYLRWCSRHATASTGSPGVPSVSSQCTVFNGRLGDPKQSNTGGGLSKWFQPSNNLYNVISAKYTLSILLIINDWNLFGNKVILYRYSIRSSFVVVRLVPFPTKHIYTRMLLDLGDNSRDVHEKLLEALLQSQAWVGSGSPLRFERGALDVVQTVSLTWMMMMMMSRWWWCHVDDDDDDGFVQPVTNLRAIKRKVTGTDIHISLIRFPHTCPPEW